MICPILTSGWLSNRAIRSMPDTVVFREDNYLTCIKKGCAMWNGEGCGLRNESSKEGWKEIAK